MQVSPVFYALTAGISNSEEKPICEDIKVSCCFSRKTGAKHIPDLTHIWIILEDHRVQLQAAQGIHLGLKHHSPLPPAIVGFLKASNMLFLTYVPCSRMLTLQADHFSLASNFRKTFKKQKTKA